MDIYSEKLKLIQWLLDVDEMVIKDIIRIKDSYKEETEIELDYTLDQSINQMRAGQVHEHEEVFNRLKKKYSQ